MRPAAKTSVLQLSIGLSQAKCLTVVLLHRTVSVFSAGWNSCVPLERTWLLIPSCKGTSKIFFRNFDIEVLLSSIRSPRSPIHIVVTSTLREKCTIRWKVSERLLIDLFVNSSSDRGNSLLSQPNKYNKAGRIRKNCSLKAKQQRCFWFYSYITDKLNIHSFSMRIILLIHYIFHLVNILTLLWDGIQRLWIVENAQSAICGT